MSSSITLSAEQRNALLDYYRSPVHEPQLRLRAHILLLLADGQPWALITSVLYCSTRTIARWKARFEQDGLQTLGGFTPGPKPRLGRLWANKALDWVRGSTPRDFGLFRSRWSCATVVLLLWQEYRLQVSRETVRLWLRQGDLVWRRPRPVLRREDPRRAEVLGQLRQLLRELPEDETAVFEDEVDLHLNPDIGSMWMPRGHQACVVTPGDNAKCYLAGSLHWRTGRLIATRGPKRNGELFVNHLHELRRRLRRYKKIHVILDNAKFHYDCRLVWEFLAEHGERVVLHFLPKYAPELNPIERIWWSLHEQITRNHQCGDLEELVDLVFAWLQERGLFKVEDAPYRIPEEPAA